MPTLSKNTAVGHKVSEFVNKCNNDKVLSAYVKKIMYIDNDSMDFKRCVCGRWCCYCMSIVVTELALQHKNPGNLPGSYLTGAIAKRLAKVNNVSIPNIWPINLIDELLFDECNVDNLTAKARELLADCEGPVSKARLVIVNDPCWIPPYYYWTMGRCQVRLPPWMF